MIFTHLRIQKERNHIFVAEKRPISRTINGEKDMIQIVVGYPCLSIDLLYNFKKVQPMPNHPRDFFSYLIPSKKESLSHLASPFSFFPIHFITMNPVKCQSIFNLIKKYIKKKRKKKRKKGKEKQTIQLMEIAPCDAGHSPELP